MKTVHRLCILLLLSGFSHNPFARAAAPRLNLFIWSEYIDPSVITDFEKKHGCEVNVDLYEDEAGMMARLQGGGAAQFDVVVPPDHLLPALIKLGLIAPLRHANLPHLKHLETRFANIPYDQGNRYSAAYLWGTLGIFARPSPGKVLEPTWGLLFDPALQPGPFVLIDSMRDLLGAALKYKGHSVNSTDPKALKEARDVLLQTKKRCLGFDGGVGGRNKVLARHARAAVVYSGDAVRSMKEDPETVYLLPREGSQIWVDVLVVCAKAPHRDLAEQFINFVLDPQVSARIANFTQFASPNRAARPFINPNDLVNPAIYPPPETLAKLEFIRDVGSHTRLYDEIWTQLKAR